MNNSQSIRTWPSPLPAAALILVFVVSLFLSFNAAIVEYPELAFAVTFDLGLSAPFFYYLAIRKTAVPKVTVFAVFGLGIATAYFCVPDDRRFLADTLAFYVLPAVELCAFGIIVFKAVGVYKSFKKNAGTGDLREIFNSVTGDIFGDTFFSRAIAFELAVFSYAFLPVAPVVSEGASFTYHRQRGTKPLYLIILFVIFAEAIVIHILVARWSWLAAWFLTLSSVYVFVFLTAHMRSMGKRPIEVTREYLTVRNGLSFDTVIPLVLIRSLKTDVEPHDPATDSVRSALLGEMEPHNVLISLREPATGSSIYGIRKQFTELAFTIDDRDRFISLLRQYGVE